MLCDAIAFSEKAMAPCRLRLTVAFKRSATKLCSWPLRTMAFLAIASCIPDALCTPCFANLQQRPCAAQYAMLSRSLSTALRMSGGVGDSKPTIGFLGMGIMGVPMSQNLVKAGYSVTVWNRSPEKCVPVVQAGASQASTPAEVVKACDITFAMLADPVAAEAVAFGPGGVVEAMSAGKGYVDVSTVDPTCAAQIAAGVRAKGGLFLEAPVSGSKKPAEDGALIFLCAGDKALYEQSLGALEVMSKKTVFLGDVGAAAKMKLVVNMIMGSVLASFSEGIALAEASGLKIDDVLDVVNNGAIACPMFAIKGPQMQAGNYPTAFPLKHAQKDMKLALLLADELGVPLPTSAAANEQYKRAKGKGRGDDDFASVHSNYREF